MIKQAYLESKVLSADPVELIRLLYYGALSAVRSAREHLASGAIAQRSAAISKALAILSELSASLNHAEGGEISRNLAGLYDYMQQRLIEANLHQDDKSLAEVLGLLATLSEAWQGIKTETEAAVPASAGASEHVPVWSNRFAMDGTGSSARAWDA